MQGDRHINIPTDVIRTLIAISETGSFSKAGERLGLSQPAISSQLKRIQSLIGDPIFNRSAAGSAPTKLGTLVIEQARLMMGANDNILRIGGAIDVFEQVRIGLSTLFVDHVLNQEASLSTANHVIVSDSCGPIAKALGERRLDIALLLNVKDVAAKVAPYIVREYEVPFAWIRAKSFALNPGQPIPLAVWTGDDFIIATLNAKGLAYRLAFNSPDYFAKLAAVKSGNCITAVPRRLVAPPFVEAKECYLPELPQMKAFLCVRPGLDIRRSADLVAKLSELEF